MNILNLICHRKPERSFHYKNHQFPVCARCTGFYITLFAYFIYAYFHYVHYNFTLILFAVILLVPAAVDGFTQLIGKRESNNTLRLITGLMGGLSLGIIVKAVKWFIFINF